MITQISNNTAYKRLYRLLYESPDKKIKESFMALGVFYSKLKPLNSF